jgi:hypothetical protein
VTEELPFVDEKVEECFLLLVSVGKSIKEGP